MNKNITIKEKFKEVSKIYISEVDYDVEITEDGEIQLLQVTVELKTYFDEAINSAVVEVLGCSGEYQGTTTAYVPEGCNVVDMEDWQAAIWETLSELLDVEEDEENEVLNWIENYIHNDLRNRGVSF